MKKVICIIITLLISFSLCISVNAENGNYIADIADLFSDSEEAKLYSLAKELSNKYNMDVVIVTSDNFGGKTAEQYADDYYDYNGYKKDGILLLLGTDKYAEYKNHICTTGKAINIFRYEISSLKSSLKSYVNKGNYYGAATAFLNITENVLTGNTGNTASGTPSPDNSLGKLFSVIGICLGIGLIIALITVFIMKSKMKNVHLATNAGEYIDESTYKINGIYETFAYVTVTRTPIPKSNTGTHTGSSGASHGGGSF